MMGPQVFSVRAGALLAAMLVSAGCAGGPARPSVTTPPPPGGDRVHATGTVVAGVEPGCFVLETGSTRYLLLTGEPGRFAGQQVAVAGLSAPTMPTTCLEGIPLVVDQITPAA